MADQNPYLARLQQEAQRNRFDMNSTVGQRKLALQEASQARSKELDDLYTQRVQAENSWVGKIGLDEQGIAGQAVNTAAGLVSGASSHILGTLATLPANVGAAAEMQGITQEDMEAYAAMQTGTANPEQEALLGREIKSKGGAVDLWRNLKGQADTVKGRLDNVKDLNEFSRNTADVFDIGSIVNRQGQADLEGDLRAGFQDNWNKVTEGSATDKVAGVAGLLKEAVAAGVNNKDGLLSYLAENLPQMALGLLGKSGKAAMLATNVGYGFDNFQKGIEEFQKENGRMPAEEELDRILGWSAAGAMAEQIGDVSVLRGFGVGKGATQAASGAATKRGVGATVAGIGKGTAIGFGSESATETFQTYAENQAQGKDTTAEDLYVAGSIGGLVGGSLRGGLSTAAAVGQGASAVAEKGAEFAQAQAEKKAAVEEAVKTGDVSKYTDPTSATYAPDTAVEALYAVARDSADPVVSSEKLQEANGVVSSLREELNTIEEQLTEKTAEESQLEDQDIDDFTIEQIDAYDKQLESLIDEVDQLGKRKEQLTKSLARSDKVMEQFTRVASALTPEQKVAPKTTQEIDGVINLSMAAPSQISDEALTALASNPQASDSQKAYASAVLSFRNASKTAEQVNTNVLYGEANGLMGIQQYRKGITTSIAAGDTATATKQLDRMKQFTARHKSKAELAAQVLAERQASGDTAQVSIAPNSQGVWSIQPNALSEAQRKKVGGLNLHKGSTKVVSAAQSEVKALDAAVAEMEAAIATKASTPANPSAATVQSPAPTQSSSAAKPASSTTSATTPAPAQRQSQEQTKNVWYGTGENANLSNLAKRPFIFQGKEYQSVEHAYQSNKSGSFDQDTFNAYKGVEGKKITGKKGTRTENNWNVRLMERLVLRSFQQNPEAMKELKATGNARITHTQDRGVWAKEFPRILQAVRNELNTRAEAAPSVTAAEGAQQSSNLGEGKKSKMEVYIPQALTNGIRKLVKSISDHFAGKTHTDITEMDPFIHQFLQETFQVDDFNNLMENLAERADAHEESLRTGGDPKPVQPKNGFSYRKDNNGEYYKETPTYVISGNGPFINVEFKGDSTPFDIKGFSFLGSEITLLYKDAGKSIKIKLEPGESIVSLNAKIDKKGIRAPSRDFLENMEGKTGIAINALFNESTSSPKAEESASVNTSKSSKPNTKTTQKQITKVEPLGEATARSKQIASEQEATVANNEDLFNDLQEALNDMAEGVEGAQERVEELQKAIDTLSSTKEYKGLYTFGEPKQTNLTNLGDKAVWSKLNLVAQFFSQKAISELRGTAKPLASVNNFLQSFKSNPGIINTFLKDTVATREQQEAVKHMFDTITNQAFLRNGTRGKSWLDRIQDNLVKPSETHRYRDMIQFLQHTNAAGKPDLDENIKVAISYGVYSWIAENAKGTKFNSKEKLNKMFGLDEDAEMDYQMSASLLKAGTRDKVLINDLGKRIIDSLGIVADKNAPVGLEQNLIASVGTHALKLAEDVGLLERNTINNAELNRAISMAQGEDISRGFNEGMSEQERKRLAQKEAKAVQYFFRAKFDANGDLDGLAKEIFDAQYKKQSILNKVFGTENYQTAPTTQPNLKDQVNAAKTKDKLPSLANDIRKKENAAPFRVLKENFRAIAALDRSVVLEIMGFDSSDLNTHHKDKRAGIEAANFALEQEYDNFMDFVADMGDGNSAIDEDLFFNHEYWSNHRVGITETLVNPQRSKFHRALLTRPDWATEISLNPENTKKLNSLKLRIMEGFGHKTEKGNEDVSLDNFETEVLGNETIMAGVRALIDTQVKPQGEQGDQDVRVETTPEHEQAILAAVKAGKEKMHAFSSLFGLAQLIHAQETGADKFTTNVTAEIDGVTNGPVLSHILMGAASSAKSLFKRIGNLGGFFSKSDEDTQYSSYRGKKGVLDLYETLMSRVLGFTKMDEVTQGHFYSLVGSLTTKEGKISSAGRNLVKTPLTALVFGSSLKGAFGSMTNKLMDTVYGNIEKVAALKAEGKTAQAQKLLDSINYMMGIGGLPNDMRLKLDSDLLENSLTYHQEDSLRAGFKEVMYAPVKQGMEIVLGDFLKRRAVFNASANAAFAVYNAARQGIIEQLLNEGMESGQIPFTIQNTDRETGLKLAKPIRNPDMGLTAELQAELEKRLAKIRPVLPSIYSKESGESNAGISLEKQKKALSGGWSSQQEVKFGSPTAIGTTSMMTSGFVDVLEAPGVRMLPMATHSFDSGISHFALMSYFNNNEELKGKHTQVLNVHDAHIVGLDQYEAAGQNLNRSTANSLMRYSPFVEMTNTVFNTVEAMTDLLRDPETAKAIQPYLSEVVKNVKFNGKNISLNNLMGMLADTTNAAEEVRLSFMAETNSVDQYAAFGGNHMITEKETAMAEKLVEKARKEPVSVPNRAVEGAIRIAVLGKNAEDNKRAAPIEFDEEAYNDKVGAILSKYLNPVQIAQAASKLPAESPAKQAVDAGKDVAKALDELPKEEAAAIAEEIITQAESTAQFSPWGDVGVPTIPSNPYLVSQFKKGVMDKDTALNVLSIAIAGMGAKGGNQSQLQFMKLTWQLLKKTLPDNLEVRMVTPETSSNDVLAKGTENSRGWFIAKGGSKHIYMLSPEHKYSGLTPELLLHELIHAAISGVIEASLQGKADKSVDALVASLEEIRNNAIEYIQANKDAVGHLAPAVVNVHELVSWGMTNKEFQDNVLSKIKGTAKDYRNGLLHGLKSFVSKLVGLMFEGRGVSKKDLMENGLAIVIQQTAGLFQAAAKNKPSVEISLDMAHTDPLTKLDSMSPSEMLDAIGQDSANVVSPAFATQLKATLDSLGTELYNAMGSIINEARADRTLTPLDAFLKTAATGKAPFAARSLVAGFPVTNQEAFAMEQVEATMNAALTASTTQTTTAFRELMRIHGEARKHVRPMDLLPEGVTEATATAAQKEAAKALWKEAFRIEGPNYMAKFVALAIGNETFASKLGFDPARTERDGKTIWEKIMQVFDKLVNLVVGRITNTANIGDAQDFIVQLAEDLVAIETKNRVAHANRFKESMFDSIEEGMEKAGDFSKEKIRNFAKSSFFKNAKNGYVQGVGTTLAVIGQPKLAGQIMDGFSVMNKTALLKRQDFFRSLVSEMRGLQGAKDVFLKLLLATKNIERERSKAGEYISKSVVKAFARKKGKFSKEERRALTQLLYIDVGTLTNQYTQAEIQKLIEDASFRDAEITKFESKLRKTKYANEMLNQTRGLGYYMATGEAKVRNLQRNAHNIARLGGSVNLGKTDEAFAIGLEADIDVLASLYGIGYTKSHNPSMMKTITNLVREEMNRTDGGNGIESMVKVHKQLLEQSKKTLFEGNEALVIKGYLPEVTNPYISFKVADAVEGEELIKLGYQKHSSAAHDPHDPTGDMYIYIIRDGGLGRWVSGSLSLSDHQRKGTAPFADKSKEVNAIFQSTAHEAQRVNTALIDPRLVKDTFMVPVMNSSGQIVNYVYTATHDTRDNALDRDSRFDHLLGTLAGNTFDKEESPVQNKNVLTALKQHYEDQLATGRTEFLRIARDSDNPEYAELWNMLPAQTKKDAAEIFGGDEIFITNDMEDLIFGYRKLSMANLWNNKSGKATKDLVGDKEYRQGMEKMFMDVVEMMMRMIAFRKGENPDDWVKRAPMYVRKGEDIWQSIVAETKDIIVVRTGLVFWGNAMSNLSVLKVYGVPFKDMIRHHRVAIKAATAYERDMQELSDVQTALDTGVLQGKDRADLEDRSNELKILIDRNPVKELIDAGLMPTIVEDLGNADDIYSYKNQLARKVEKYTDKLNPTVKQGIDFLYMGQKTSLYGFANRSTQLSDFVARYTLYHHLQERKVKPLSRDEAISRASEAFVNYDVPTHRSMQYMNDMGFLMFTKYYLRIQRVILQLFEEKPANMLMLGLFSGFFDGTETILDSNMLGRLGNNPLTTGALRYPSALDDIGTINLLTHSVGLK